MKDTKLETVFLFQFQMIPDMELHSNEYLDSETGEISYCDTWNVETGEYEGELHYLVKKFKIPRSYFTTDAKKSTPMPRKRQKCQQTEIDFIHALIFLLPTMILFHPVLGIVVCVAEFFLHTWSHRKNKQLKSSTVYFQSPLHLISKELCGRCKAQNEAMQITKLLKNDKFKKAGLDYIKRIVT